MSHHRCYNVRKYVECTREERVSLASIIQEINVLSTNTRDKGVQWLIDELPRLGDSSVLGRGIALVVDGTDPQLAREILHTSCVFSQKTGVELLRDIIAMEGVLAIQSGNNPRIIEELLLSYVGEDAVEDVRKPLNEWWEKYRDSVTHK